MTVQPAAGVVASGSDSDDERAQEAVNLSRITHHVEMRDRAQRQQRASEEVRQLASDLATNVQIESDVEPGKQNRESGVKPGKQKPIRVARMKTDAKVIILFGLTVGVLSSQLQCCY